MSIFDWTIRKSADARASEFENRLTAIAYSVSGRFARGNIALQYGSVVTREQLDAERAELREYASSR